MAYNTDGQVTLEQQASGVETQYEYYSHTQKDVSLGQKPAALKDMKIVLGSTTLSETDYKYDAIGRLYTQTIIPPSGSATTYTYGYVGGTSMVSNMAVSVSGSTKLSTTYNYDPNTDRLAGIEALAPSTIYSTGYDYSALGQISGDEVLQTDAQTDENENLVITAHDYGYDSQDQLHTVTTGNTDTVTYNYNSVGARTDLGTVNVLNQYSSIGYNGRGDETNDGVYVYTWDAKNRLISIVPVSSTPSTGAEEDIFTYDGEDRRIEKDILDYSTSTHTYVLAQALKFVYDGRLIIAEMARCAAE